MAIVRLPTSVCTLQSEALEQALALERVQAFDGMPSGSLVAKEIGGRTYLYWQIARGAQRWQRYLGADTPETRRDIDALLNRQELREADSESLSRLSAMLRRGGAAREDAAVGAVLELLAELGVFRRGGVLVGTQAFRCYGNLLGVKLPEAIGRTQDIDVAHDLAIAMAASEDDRPAVGEELGRIGLLPVPGLDPREASTSFKFRGRELRVDFLTPAARNRAGRPVYLPAFGVAAQPLAFLDFLIADPVPALVLSRTAVAVRVPDSARFALHKLWTASQRPVHQQTKARKDREQAAALLEVLAEDRPGDLNLAWQALAARKSARGRIAREVRRLDPALVDKLRLRT